MFKLIALHVCVCVCVCVRVLVSVFAYGATGAGKTYTMLGTVESPGVTFSAVMALFSKIDDCKNERVCDVSISYLEVVVCLKVNETSDQFDTIHIHTLSLPRCST